MQSKRSNRALISTGAITMVVAVAVFLLDL